MREAEVGTANRPRLARLRSPTALWSLTMLAAAAALVVGAALRLLDLNHQGFNSDEAVYSGQSAALAGHGDYAALFGVFRAHPLLVQFATSVIFRVTGVNDVAPRLLGVGMGLALVVVTGLLAGAIRGRVAGIAAMSLMAISAYPVAVSRQFLLDGPEAFFVTLSLLFLVLYLKQPARVTLYAAAAGAGMAFLCKETAILMIPAILVFFVSVPGVRVSFVRGLEFMVVYLITISPFPLALMLGGGTKVAQQFLVWQIFRRPNHDAAFYLLSLRSVGAPVLALAAVGVVVAMWRRRPADILMVLVIVVIAGFYEIWPVKGFQYLVPLVGPVGALAGVGVMAIGGVFNRALASQSRAVPRWSNVDAQVGLAVLAVALAGSLISSSGLHPQLTVTAAAASDEPAVATAKPTFLAGTGGLEGGRSAGLWVRANTLPGSRFLTIGPSFANIIAFYGQRHAQGLSVSTNPLHRNPTYEPTDNPDLLIRTGAVQYVVFDEFSAQRAPFFGRRLLAIATKYNGIVVYTGYSESASSGGSAGRQRLIRIYQVHR